MSVALRLVYSLSKIGVVLADKFSLDLSDAFEFEVAQAINSIGGNVSASRPSVGVQFPDVLVRVGNVESWLEVKMNSRDNLSNPRVFFDGTSWNQTYATLIGDDEFEEFGKSISLNDTGNILAVGSPRYDEDDDANINKGKVTVYNL